MSAKVYPTITAKVSELKPHPKNYREHPEDQLNHIIHSIEQHGIYRNVVIANDSTILAGHGVVKACRKMGLEEIPVIKLDIDFDSIQALKLLAGDNEIGRLAAVDDRMLSELLKEVKEFDKDGLIGSGYDAMMLANLAMVTRPAHEIKDIDEAAEWLGMPDYEPKEKEHKYILIFRSAEDREQFSRLAELAIGKPDSKTWSTWWPARENEDISSVMYDKQ